MAKHGSVGEYNSDGEDWVSYIERLQNYFVANEVTTETKKRAILLSVCGAQTYQLIRNLCAPVKPADKEYPDLIKLVKDHYSPRRSEIVQRFKFNMRSRQSQETIATFVAELRKLSEFCNYGDMLEDMLRDRIVCGINNPAMQRRLLAESGLTLSKALEIAQGMEAADRSAKVMQGTEQKPVPVQRVQSVGLQKAKINLCYRCGGSHLAYECKFKEAQCYMCKRRGHIAKACRNSGRSLLIEIKESQGDKLTLLRNKRQTRHQGNRTHCLRLDRKEVSQFEYQY